MTSVKVAIKAEIKAKKLTQTVLARRLRCSTPFLSMVISGRKTSKRIQAGLAAYLGKSVSELWPEEQKNTPTPAGRNSSSVGDGGRAPDPSRG